MSLKFLNFDNEDLMELQILGLGKNNQRTVKNKIYSFFYPKKKRIKYKMNFI